MQAVASCNFYEKNIKYYGFPVNSYKTKNYSHFNRQIWEMTPTNLGFITDKIGINSDKFGTIDYLQFRI